MEKISSGKKTIVFVDDNNQISTLLAEIESISDSFVIIKTDTNRITLPRERILKIKEALK
jgi:preprotein translocase subunit YajC